MSHILHTQWTARCLSRPQSALLSHGVGPPVVAILAGGPGRGDEKLTWTEGTKTVRARHPK